MTLERCNKVSKIYRRALRTRRNSLIHLSETYEHSCRTPCLLFSNYCMIGTKIRGRCAGEPPNSHPPTHTIPSQTLRKPYSMHRPTSSPSLFSKSRLPTTATIRSTDLCRSHIQQPPARLPPVNAYTTQHNTKDTPQHQDQPPLYAQYKPLRMPQSKFTRTTSDVQDILGNPTFLSMQ